MRANGWVNKVNGRRTINVFEFLQGVDFRTGVEGERGYRKFRCDDLLFWEKVLKEDLYRVFDIADKTARWRDPHGKIVD